MTELKSALEAQPNHVQARVLLAELSLWLGDLEGADKEIDRALSAGAAEGQVRALRYEVLLAERRFDELKALLAKDTTTPGVRRLVLQAQAESGGGDAARAEETLNTALQENPNDPQALIESARLKAGRGEFRPALELPERITQSDEMKARAQILRGQVLMARGDYQEARDAFGEAHAGGSHLRVPEQIAAAASLTEANLMLNDAVASEKSLSAVARWAPQALITHYLRARIAMLKNDPAAAAAECQKALRIDPQHTQSQILLAAAHLSQGSLEQAEDVLTRLLTSRPGNPAARRLLAQVYLGRNQPERAQRVLGAAPAGADDDAGINWLMGAALLKSGSNASGLEYLERSVAADPGNLSRRLDLATAYIATQQPARAVEILKSLPAASPVTRRANALLVLATAAGKPPTEALGEIQNLVAKHGDDSTVLSPAGAYLAAIGDANAGRELLKRAIQIEPEAVDARLALARVEADARNLTEAQRQLREVVKIDPAHQMARVTLSELAWSTGDRAQSRKWLEEAISADPSAVEARLRLAQIAFVEADAPRARSLLDQAVSVARDRKTVLSAAGKVFAQAGFADEAFAKFREASAAGYPNAILEAAQLHMDLDQRNQARELIESALAQKPKWFEAERMLVTIDARDGQAMRAIARAKVLAGGTTPGAERALEGDLYALAGQPSDAITAYEDAQRLQPNPSLAIKIFNARRAAGAKPIERSLTQWLNRKPDDANVRRVLAAYYESTGDNELAVTEYERLLTDGRIDPIMLNNLAWSLHVRGDARALDLAQRAYTAAPHFAEIGDTYGWILVQMGKVAEGLNVLEKALASTPANPDIQYHAAVAYTKAGHPERAGELLRRALQAHEKFSSRNDAEQLARALSTGGAR